ncbi:hypothetical protein PI93_019430 [Pandoraea fibrosis]|uniref:Translocator protein BipD n=1 Tax=Pandoraea fibrosis TaxID=1891094 RepID=A0ABX6HUL2_9BURK|nr:hypothetical protein [Pandoraea fibrosis]QHE91859.1 hypothetical protein PJ20_008570 [Pandoraea fibrosis]QHF14584.1 hypothetical protein PI93_019430 [Pandoraea fibrosis]
MSIIFSSTFNPQLSRPLGTISANVAPTESAPALNELVDPDDIETQVKTTLEREFAHLPLEAKALYLDNLNVRVKQKIPSLVQHLESLPPEQKSTISAFEEVLKKIQNQNTDPKMDLVGDYTKYIVAISELVTKINKLMEGGAEGKNNINGREILRELDKFCGKWGKDSRPLAKYDNLEDAKRVAGRFRAGTVEVVKANDGYEVRLSFSRLIPIAEAVNSPSAVIDNLKAGRSPLHGGLDNNRALDKVHGKNMNNHTLQSVQLATQEVQKTHQTDVETLTHEMDRALKWLDNIGMAHSQHMSKWTETMLAFLH